MKEIYELEKRAGLPDAEWKRMLKEKRDIPNLKITWPARFDCRPDFEVLGRLDKARGVTLRDDIRPGLIFLFDSYIASVKTPYGWLRRQFGDLDAAREWQDDMESIEWE